jgi:hypothetical protein
MRWNKGRQDRQAELDAMGFDLGDQSGGSGRQ